MPKQKSRSPQDWHQATIDALVLSGKRVRSAQTYAREVRLFIKWLGRAPETATEEDLRAFLLYRRNECQLANASMRILCAGLRFFFQHVLRREWPLIELMKGGD
jgi:site-specific recombinase XerD